MGIVINPIRLHQDQELSGHAAKLMAHACYVFQLGGWRKLRREAEARNDFDMLDDLDRAYERIGLP